MAGLSADDRDPLDALLAQARPRAPEGLAARLATCARDPVAGRRVFWADVERSSRTVLRFAAAAAVLAVVLAASFVVLAPVPDGARATASVRSMVSNYDDELLSAVEEDR